MSTHPVEHPLTIGSTHEMRDRSVLIVQRADRIEYLGAIVMRCGLALIFLWFGAMKFTSYEATGIAPFITNSPLVSWWHAVLGLQGASYMLGAFELATGAMLLAGFIKPVFSTIAGVMGAVTFLITLSFLFTTPGVAEPLAGGFPALSAVPGQFLLKDLGLLAISIFILSESLSGVRSLRGRNGPAALAERFPTAGKEVTSGAETRSVARIALRYALVIIFLWFGCMKFTSYEATGIAPFIMNSPFVGWWHTLFGIQGASYMLGVLEITTGILLALYPIARRAAVVGGVMAILTFLITLSFLFTTPGVTAPMGFPAISANVGQFLLKDVGLLGISIWLLGEALTMVPVYLRRAPMLAVRSTESALT